MGELLWGNHTVPTHEYKKPELQSVSSLIVKEWELPDEYGKRFILNNIPDLGTFHIVMIRNNVPKLYVAYWKNREVKTREFYCARTNEDISFEYVYVGTVISSVFDCSALHYFMKIEVE